MSTIKSNSLFIITKPLQLLIVMCIIRFKQYENNEIIICNTFKNSKNLFENLIKHTDYVYKYCEDRKSLLISLQLENYKELYIDTDVGMHYFRQIKLIKDRFKTIKINIFEEGNGTYQYMYNSVLRKFFYKTLGVGSYFGGCKYTDYVYVFNKKKYIKNFKKNKSKVKEIIYSVQEEISNNIELYNDIFSFEIKHFIDLKRKNTAMLFLTRKDYNKDYKKYLSDKKDNFLKPHPALVDSFLNCKNISLIKGEVLAELVIINLSNIYRYVEVFSYSSSTEMYIELPNVRFNVVDK